MFVHFFLGVLLDDLRLDDLADPFPLSLLTRAPRLPRNVLAGAIGIPSPHEDIGDAVDLPLLRGHPHLSLLLEEGTHPPFFLNKNSADAIALTLAWKGMALSSLAQ